MSASLADSGVAAIIPRPGDPVNPTRQFIGRDDFRAESALWLPYAEVPDVYQSTERAQMLGASVSLEPREGPAGWRSIVAAPSGAEIALWQPKW
jgi:predicted enzyme related to lactoylglutathione lyase